MARFPASLALLGAFLAACALPLARGDCCFASSVTSSYAPACNDCTAPEGLLSTCGVAACNIFGCGCSGGCRTGCQMGTVDGQPILMCAAPDAPNGTDSSAAAAPAAEGTDASNGRRRRLKQSGDATGADALAADDSAAAEDASTSMAETDLLEVTGAATGTDNTTVAVMPPCRPPSSATEPADIFFYFLCLDTDADGFLSFDEACTNGLPGCADALDAGDNSTLAALRTQFLALDANADGQLSTAEFDAELDGFLPYGNSTDAALSPAAEVVPVPVPVTPASTSAGSRSRLFAMGAAVVTALLALINA